MADVIDLGTLRPYVATDQAVASGYGDLAEAPWRELAARHYARRLHLIELRGSLIFLGAMLGTLVAAALGFVAAAAVASLFTQQGDALGVTGTFGSFAAFGVAICFCVKLDRGIAPDWALIHRADFAASLEIASGEWHADDMLERPVVHGIVAAFAEVGVRLTYHEALAAYRLAFDWYDGDVYLDPEFHDGAEIRDTLARFLGCSETRAA